MIHLQHCLNILDHWSIFSFVEFSLRYKILDLQFLKSPLPFPQNDLREKKLKRLSMSWQTFRTLSSWNLKLVESVCMHISLYLPNLPDLVPLIRWWHYKRIFRFMVFLFFRWSTVIGYKFYGQIISWYSLHVTVNRC